MTRCTRANIFFQTQYDGHTICNVLTILRESVAAKTPWRPSNLEQLLRLDATLRITEILVQLFKKDELTDRGIGAAFWLLSALATKGWQQQRQKKEKCNSS